MIKRRFPELTCPPLFSVRNWYCTLWSGNAACETPVMVTAACSSVPTVSPATHRHIRNFYCRINLRPPQVFNGRRFIVNEPANEPAVKPAVFLPVEIQVAYLTATNISASIFSLGFFFHYEGALGCCRRKTSIDTSHVQIHTQILELQAAHVPVSGLTLILKYQYLLKCGLTGVNTYVFHHSTKFYFFDACSVSLPH